MSIYVSELHKKNPKSKWRWDWIAFLFSENRHELHDFAHKLGLQGWMFNNCAHCPCYPLTTSKRFQAINSGAIPLDDDSFRSKIKNSTAGVENQNGN